MLFDFDQPDELLTPNITHGGVNQTNPILTPNDISSFDDNDVYFSSIPSKKNEYELRTKDNPTETSDDNHQQQQDYLFSSFDFPVLSELSRTDLQLDGLQLDRYLSQVSLPSSPTDVHNTSISDDSTFFPIDDSASSTFLWVGEECTVESNPPRDMMVPPSPPISSVSSSPSISNKESTKKRSVSISERKLRKKDQNKSAAEKYRLKKRTERNELITRHLNLKNQNKELKFEMESLTFQLEQFKQLFVDVLKIPIPSTVSK
jgi:hypothetical protein